MSITLAQLSRKKASASPEDYYHKKDELGLFDSYKRHLQIAELLGSEPHKFYRDGWLSLLISIECFLKDIYCVVRFEIWNDKFPSNLEHKEFYHRKKLIEQFIAKSFNHELKELAKYLWEICPELKEDDSYKAFELNLPNYNWTKNRYEVPIDRNYKTNYETLLRNFKGLLEHSFGEWK